MHGLVIPPKPKAPKIDIKDWRARLWASTDINEILDIGAKLDALEDYMEGCGLYSKEDMRPINETRMEARWKLGQALGQFERAKHPGKGKVASSSLTSLLKEIDLTRETANAARRLSTLPVPELQKAFATAHKEERLLYLNELITLARPYWYKENRQAKHETIHVSAKAQKLKFGPFPLLYADPPWRFEIYSEKGAERTADQHYPTLSIDEIKELEIDDKPISRIAHKDAALFLWCTSSNMHRALEVMAAWDFEFKTSAIWDKEKSGLGLVFRNQHEVLLYGTRGKMPGPQYQPKSVFRFPRARHSAKPPQIRKAIERMYPDFDETTRLEMFYRGDKLKGWSVCGFESESDAVD